MFSKSFVLNDSSSVSRHQDMPSSGSFESTITWPLPEVDYHIKVLSALSLRLHLKTCSTNRNVPTCARIQQLFSVLFLPSATYPGLRKALTRAPVSFCKTRTCKPETWKHLGYLTECLSWFPSPAPRCVSCRYRSTPWQASASHQWPTSSHQDSLQPPWSASQDVF